MAVAIVSNSASGTPAGQSNGFAAGTLTFAGLKGSNFLSGNKVIVFFFGQNSGANTTPVNPQIGGNACTVIDASGNAAATFAAFYVDLGANATDTFTITDGGDWNTCAVIAWEISGAASGAPSSFVTIAYPGTNTPETFSSITTPSNGLLIAGGGTRNTGGATPVWTNCSASAGDMTTSITTVLQIMGAHSVNAGATVITNNTTGVAFAFGGIVLALATPAVGGSTNPSATLTMMGVG